MTKTLKYVINMHIIPLNKQVCLLPAHKNCIDVVRDKIKTVSLLLLLFPFLDDSNV